MAWDGPHFDVAHLSDIWAHYRSDQGVTVVSGAVSQWNDQSVNARHMTQGTAGLRPTFTAGGRNGKPDITADGVDDFLQTAAITLNQPFTTVLTVKVASLPAAGVHDALFDGKTAVSGVGILDNTPRFFIGSGAFVTASGTFCVGAYNTLVSRCNSPGNSDIWYQGQLLASGTAGGNPGGFTLFALGDGTRSIAASCQMVSIFSAALTDQKLSAVIKYHRAFSATA